MDRNLNHFIRKHQFFLKYIYNIKIVAAFQGMQVSPAKQSYSVIRDYQESVTTGQTHTRTDGRTDR